MAHFVNHTNKHIDTIIAVTSYLIVDKMVHGVNLANDELIDSRHFHWHNNNKCKIQNTSFHNIHNYSQEPG